VIYFTVILMLYFLFPDFTVMVALPFFFALITPDLLTVTIFLLELDHVTFCKLVTGVSAALSFRLWPRFSVAFFP
jgi:hypothetical protein